MSVFLKFHSFPSKERIPVYSCGSLERPRSVSQPLFTLSLGTSQGELFTFGEESSLIVRCPSRQLIVVVVVVVVIIIVVVVDIVIIIKTKVIEITVVVVIVVVVVIIEVEVEVEVVVIVVVVVVVVVVGSR